MTLAELTTPLTRAEVQASIYAAIEALGAKTTNWKAGGVARAIITAIAIVVAALSTLVARIAAAGFLELSSGEWLTQVALYVYGVERDPGTFATGSVTLDNSGGGIYAGAAGDLVVYNPTTGKEYFNTEAYSLGAMETGVVVPVQAAELGSASTAAGGTITGFRTPLGTPGVVTVTNAGAVVGTDPETDASLRERCRAKTGSLSPNGPRDAYLFFARGATRADGQAIGVTRVRSVPDGNGRVDVYVATASGGITGTVGDLETDLGAVDEAIQTSVAPLAVTAVVQSATPVTIGVVGELWIRDTTGYTAPEIEQLVDARLAALMSSTPIGGHKLTAVDPGRVYVSAIAAVIGGIIDDVEVRVTVTTPAADVELAIDEAPVLGTVAVSVNFVSGGTF